MTAYKIPSKPSVLTGRTIAKVIAVKETKSPRYGEPQLQFDFLTEKDTRFSLWCNVTSRRSVETFLDAGILRRIGDDEFEVTPIASQPRLAITLKDGKLEKFGHPEA